MFVTGEDFEEWREEEVLIEFEEEFRGAVDFGLGEDLDLADPTVIHGVRRFG